MATVHGHLPTLAIVRSLRVRLCFAFLLGLGLDTSAQVTTTAAATSPTALTPLYWQQRLFFIPYQVNKSDGTVDQIAKVQLLMSRNGATDWQTLQEANADVRGFGYHAPEDGEYWFALRHLDKQGKPWPSPALRPQMRITVDTTQPELTISGALGNSGVIEVRYESRDANLRPEDLIVEVRSAGGTWSRVQLGPPDVSQPSHLLGSANWTFPHTAKPVELRASITDKAGHRAQTTADVTVAGPALHMPVVAGNSDTKESGQSSATADPFQAASQLPSRNWPANNRLPSPQSSLALNPLSKPALRPLPPVETPPLRNPYSVTQNPNAQSRVSAQLVGDSGLNTSNDSTDWAPPPRPAVATTGFRDRMVNSLAFDIEYDLQSVGPWGVSKVELWGSHDEGRTWQSYSVDSDNRSPVRVSVPGEGVYGFRILVDGANGVGAPPPQSGDKPELIVAVDLQAPRAELVSTELGQGNLADHLIMRWTVDDRNLDPRPVSLFYGVSPNGPWSIIAAGLENTGVYSWRLQRHMPNQFYVRLEARDMAGNVAMHQSPAPISLARPQPTGRLNGVRSVEK